MARKGFEMSLRNKEVHHGGSAMKKVLRTSLAVAACLIAAIVAYAAVTFDPQTGVGFVGKGDVQDTFGWNNKALQDNAGNIQFRALSEVETEVSWVCTNSINENTQERARTTTTTIQGVVSSIARDRNQITGFNLTGYSGTPTQNSDTDGPQLNSCPSGPWTLTTPAGDPEVVSTTSTLQVCYNGCGSEVNWADL
jgi:hypothetical protein